MAKDKGPWIVGGNEVQGFVVSRAIRQNEVCSAREWVEHVYKGKRLGRVRTFQTREKAQALCDKYNRYQ